MADKDPKSVTLIVNGKPKPWPKKEISYSEVVSLAYDGNPPTGPNLIFTVVFRKGDDSRKEGSLVDGQSVKVKDEMVFSVTATDKS